MSLLDGKGAITDWLRVENYYADLSARVESVELSDGSSVWGVNDFALLRRHGGTGNDYIYGWDGKKDIFDSDAGGNDWLYGYGGDDEYWLGRGTGHDTIKEHYDNSGDTGDKIKVKSGLDADDVRLSRDRDHL